jgi:hypothetical protein
MAMNDLSRGRRVAAWRAACAAACCAVALSAGAAPAAQTLDLPTRPGVTQRLVLIVPEAPRAVVLLLAGGHGGLRIDAQGGFGWGEGNFVVRTRDDFAAHGLAVAVVDAPSDRQQPPFLDGFRQGAEHAADLRAVIAAMRHRFDKPVWLVGTSRGTQSVAAVAIALADTPDAPDGIVLTSTILRDRKSRTVLQMDLGRLRAPVLVVHHEHDDCGLCPPADLPWLMRRLTASSRVELKRFEGGSTRGDECGAFAHHGYNGIEDQVVAFIAQWIAPP